MAFGLLSQSNGAGIPKRQENIFGTWVNDDPNTRNIAKVIVLNDYTSGLQAHAFGACTPSPCDWGVVGLKTTNQWKYSAIYDFSATSSYRRIVTLYFFFLNGKLTLSKVEGTSYDSQIIEKFHRQ
jgi:hypothetical protein